MWAQPHWIFSRSNSKGNAKRFYLVRSYTSRNLLCTDMGMACELTVCNNLLRICEISASWQSLMDASWKGFNVLTGKYSNALEGKLDVNRITKSLCCIIDHKFKECVALAPRHRENVRKYPHPDGFLSFSPSFIGTVSNQK